MQLVGFEAYQNLNKDIEKIDWNKWQKDMIEKFGQKEEDLPLIERKEIDFEKEINESLKEVGL